jgi:pimeloyl-ACP methyl ester carboxylesterase
MMPIPTPVIHDFGGRGPALHLALANGFPPETYRPLLAPLLESHQALSVLPRALWHNGVTPDSARSWRVMADDMLAGLRARDLTDVIAVGHSMGGVASMMAALAEPGRFRALILLDPTMLLPGTLRLIAALRLIGLSERFPLVQGARRRRRTFASIEAAYTYFRNRRLFADWPDETIRLYAAGITRPAPRGGVELSWTPEWEAQYYRTIFAGSWRLAPRLCGLLPILVIRGKTTDTFVAPAAERLRRLLPDADQAVIPGHGHLFPQSAPAETAGIIMAWLAKL